MNSAPSLLIRPATLQDAVAISALIHSVAHYFTLHPQGEGAEAFLQTIGVASIAGFIAAPNFHYLVGEVSHEGTMTLAGVVAMRDRTHLYHLFVAPHWQRQGIARQLWQAAQQAALAAEPVTTFTVHSTPYAVPMYENFGFFATGPKLETMGIAFVPMQLSLAVTEV